MIIEYYRFRQNQGELEKTDCLYLLSSVVMATSRHETSPSSREGVIIFSFMCVLPVQLSTEVILRNDICLSFFEFFTSVQSVLTFPVLRRSFSPMESYSLIALSQFLL